jgi:hypothetical protein
MARPRSSPLVHSLAAAVATAWIVAIAPAAAADVEAWVGQLGADQFARREAAARSLVAVGRPATDAVARAIRGGDLEVASRGIDVLRQLLDAGDRETAAAAAEVLERLALEGDTSVRRLAAAATEFHLLGRAATARERLESLGAILRERSAVEGRGLGLEIDAAWRGRPDDLREVGHLPRLVELSIRGVPVDGATLSVLGGLRGLQRLELFGTGAGPDEARQLAERLPDTRIDVRRGGRLGVSSTPPGTPCEIQTVEPGSAADQAGLRSGDVIISIDGVAVARFDELTGRLGESAPGDVIRLVVARRDGTADGGPERIECQVRLDAW